MGKTKYRHRSNPEQSVDETFNKCSECGKLISKLDIYDSKYCKDCFDLIEKAKANSMKRCSSCHKIFQLNQISKTGHCINCEKNIKKCRKCGDNFLPEKNEIYCPVCYADMIKVCKKCKKEFLPTKNQKYCKNCSKIIKNTYKNKDLSPVNVSNSQNNSFFGDKSIIEDSTIELWIKDLETFETQESTIENFIKVGYKAVEPLIQTFAEGNRSLNYKIHDILVKIGEVAVNPLIASLEEINVDVKINSIKTLGDIGDKKAIDPLIEALDDYDKSVRKNVVKALAQIDDERVLEPLIEALDDDSFYVRRSAAKSLGILGNSNAVQALCKSLKDDNTTVKISAAVSLGYIQSQDSLDDLIDCLDDKNPEVVKIIEDVVIKLKSPEFLKEIKLITSNKEPKVLKLNKEEFLALIQNIFDDDPDVRVDAAKQFGKIKHEKSVDYLLKALDDSYEAVVIAAVSSLGKLGFTNTIQHIIPLLNGQLPVRTAAEEALADFGSKGLNEISESLDKENADVRYALVLVLGDIDDEKANNLLISLINDLNHDVKLKSIDLLGHKRDNNAINYLAEIYNEEDFKTKKHIIKSLGLIGGNDVLKLFSEINEPHPRLKNLICEHEIRIKSKIEKEDIKKENETNSDLDSKILEDKEIIKAKGDEINIEKEFSESKSSIKNPLDLLEEIKKPLDND